MIRRLVMSIKTIALCQRGQAFVEYALLISGVSLALLGAFSVLDLSGLITKITNAVK